MFTLCSYTAIMLILNVNYAAINLYAITIVTKTL